MKSIRSSGFQEEDIAVAVNALDAGSYAGGEVDQQAQQQMPTGKPRGKFARSWSLFKSSLKLLSQDKSMMLFPVISSIASLLALIGIVLPFAFLTGIFSSIANEESISNVGFYAVLFIYYLITYFVVTFFNSALVSCVQTRLAGGDPTVGSGLRGAWSHVGKIFMWSLIAATVGLLLRIILDQIAERLGPIGQMITSVIVGIIGFAWGVATYFVVPVIIVEDLSAKDSIKKSAALFKKTWGENLIGNIGMGLFFFLLILAGVGFFVAFAIMVQSTTAIIIGAVALIFFFIVLGIIASTLQVIFMTVLYLYATTGKVADGFDVDVVQGAFKQKKKLKAFGLST